MGFTYTESSKKKKKSISSETWKMYIIKDTKLMKRKQFTQDFI